LEDIPVEERFTDNKFGQFDSVDVLGGNVLCNLSTGIISVLETGCATSATVELVEVPLDSPAHSPAIPCVCNVIGRPGTDAVVALCQRLIVVWVEENQFVFGALRVGNSDVELLKGLLVVDLKLLDLLTGLVMSSGVSGLELN